MAHVSDMKQVLDRNIKDIIAEYPDAALALANHGIGCATCNVGTCRLKDIVDMHALSEEDEKSLFQRIASLIFPGQSVEIPRIPRKAAGSAKARLSPPMELLIEEHRQIKKVLAAIPRLIDSLESTLEDKKDTIREVTAFVRQYADAFHHAKEEDILFVQFAQTEIIEAMRQEHEIGRGHIRAVLAGLESNDAKAIADHLVQYALLLNEHIRKEDEILYPWMDRNLTDSQIGKLFAQCTAIERAFGDTPNRFVAFAEDISALK